MATNPNATQITPPRVPIIDERTGAVSREWYRWFYSLYQFAGGGTGILPVTSGGTGLDTIPTNGQLLIGNGTGYTLNTLGVGVGISVTNGLGTITLANTGVLSNIAGSGISVSGATGNVTITNAGVLSFAGGTTGLTPAAATTGAVTLAGTLGTANGGTNGSATPTTNGIAYGTGTAYAFSAAGTTGQVLTATTGSAPTWAAPATSGTVTSVSFTGGIITVATPTTTPAFTVAGTSGGVPYFASGTTWASSAALNLNSLVIGGGAGAAPATTATGTGVVTALGVNTGTAGAFVVNGGALGTPSSGTVTNLTGTASININGTVGATTPTTGAFTTLSSSGLATLGASPTPIQVNRLSDATTYGLITFNGASASTTAAGIFGRNSGSDAGYLYVTGANGLILQIAGNTKTTLDTTGNLQMHAGAVMPYAPAPAAISAAATLTNANIQGQIISATGTTYTITMPLGTTLETLATWAITNISYDFYVINTATGVITMAVNTGVTSLGSLTIAIGASAHFRIRRTAANTFVLYRLN